MLHITTTDNNCAKNLFDLIDKSQENDYFTFSHYAELSRIENIPLSELCAKNKNLLVFPDNAKKTYGSIGDEKIFEMSGRIDYHCYAELDSLRRLRTASTNKIPNQVRNDTNQNIKIKTGNLMGFLGIGSAQIQITSRFAQPVVEPAETTNNTKTTTKDFFLHYMLSKVFCPNLLDLKFDAFSAIKNQFDYLCFLFPFYLKKAMAQGIFKTYQKFERNDANVRGAINVSRHIAQNIPFAGKVAYTELARAYDNSLTQLVRHTIELIKTKPFGKAILSEKHTKPLVLQIVEVTPIYNFFEREKIIFKNAKPLSHPFFTEWKPLQKLCLAILKNQKISFHADSNEVYGILFDGAWLWEEYLVTILTKEPHNFIHPKNKESRGGLHFFDNNADEEHFDKNYRKIYPDFYKPNEIILDAKYKHLENGVGCEDLYQVVSYIHTMSKPNEKVLNGGFVYPEKDCGFSVADTEFTEVQPPKYKLAGLGGEISLFGFKIPQNANDFVSFCKEIKESEEKLNRL